MSQPIIIMGANGGIGGALAKRLIDKGQDVFLTAQDADTLSDFDAPAASVDVFDEDSITTAIEEADGGEGFKGLAYCIGSINLKPFKRTTDDDYMKTMELNFLGAARALRAAEDGLKKGKGSVVLFSTIAMEQGFPQHSAISSAKGALEGLGRTLAAEWAPNVRVNIIAPSLTDTGIAKGITSSEQMAEAVAKMHPIPRLGTADDSAAAAEFLLSEDSSWMTGQTLHIDGGRSTLRTKG